MACVHHAVVDGTHAFALQIEALGCLFDLPILQTVVGGKHVDVLTDGVQVVVANGKGTNVAIQSDVATATFHSPHRRVVDCGKVQHVVACYGKHPFGKVLESNKVQIRCKQVVCAVEKVGAQVEGHKATVASLAHVQRAFGRILHQNHKSFSILVANFAFRVEVHHAT